MAFDQTIHETLQGLAASLQATFDEKVKAAAAELAAASEEDRLAVEAESTSKLAAELAAVRAESEQRIASEAARLRAEVEQAAADLSNARAEVEQARAEAEKARSEATAARDEAQQARNETEESRNEAAGARAELDQARAEAASAGNRAEQAAAELAEARKRASVAEEALDTLRQATAAGRIEDRERQLAGFERLVADVRRLDQAATLSDVLSELAAGVAAETPRSAVLVAAAGGFQVFRMNGITGTPRAITAAEAANLARGLPFAALPADHVGFTVPVEVGGQNVAMVYADDCLGEQETVPACWPEAVEVLARHAALRLETLTALKTVQALNAARRPAPVSTAGRSAPAMDVAPSTTEDDRSARRYARLLVSEIKLYNEATVHAGRQHRDLLERLRPEIERARRLYEERVPAHVPARATYFDDELVQTLADGDPGLLGSRK